MQKKFVSKYPQPPDRPARTAGALVSPPHGISGIHGSPPGATALSWLRGDRLDLSIRPCSSLALHPPTETRMWQRSRTLLQAEGSSCRAPRPGLGCAGTQRVIPRDLVLLRAGAAPRGQGPNPRHLSAGGGTPCPGPCFGSASSDLPKIGGPARAVAMLPAGGGLRGPGAVAFPLRGPGAGPRGGSSAGSNHQRWGKIPSYCDEKVTCGTAFPGCKKLPPVGKGDN